MGLGAQLHRSWRRARGAILIACALLACAPAAAGAKRSAPPPEFFGVAAFQTPSNMELSHMRRGGIGSLRIPFYHAGVERERGRLDWTYYDLLIGRAARAGVTLAPLLFGVPSWMDQRPGRMPIDSPAQEAAWSGFVTAAADRYGPGGAFWSANPGLPAHPIVDWEVWNEPNLNGFVAGPPTARRYSRLLRVTHAALRAAGPPARTIVGGLYVLPKKGAGPSLTAFLSRLYRVKGARRLFDGVAIHPYGSSPRRVLETVHAAREVMDANRDPRSTLFVTEVGWTTGGDGWARSLYRTDPAGQARNLARTYRALIRERRDLRLAQITWHAWRDYAGPTTLPGWIYQMGLFSSGGQPKPAWEALRRIARGERTGPISDLGTDPTPPPAAPPAKPKPPSCLLPGLLC